MVFLEIILSFGLSGLLSLLLFNWILARWQEKRLQNTFYKLLIAQNGCLSLIQLTATANVDAPTARLYLDQQLRLLDGTLDVDEEGNPFYRFPKLHPPSPSTDEIAHD
jgi:hypothetical protein